MSPDWDQCRVVRWLGRAVGWVIGLGFYFLINYLVEPLCWIVIAPSSVWAGIENQWYKLWHGGKEPGDR